MIHRRTGRTIALVCAAIAGVGALATPASAQVSSIFLDEWDLGFTFSRTSARLSAMGGVSIAVADETTELDMWDFGRNVAGFLYDRDAWTGDFWAATASRNRSASGIGSSGTTIESGFQLSFRNFQRALGIEGALTSSRDEQRSGAERRKFDGPRVSVVANHAIGESVVIGLGLSFLDESEKVSSTNPLAIAHSTSRRDWRLGLVYYAGDHLELGASATASDNRINGVSEDGFHRDKSQWDRPVTEFGLQAIYAAESFAVGAFGSRGRLDGGEYLDISWSREFFLNPSGVDLSIRVPVLDEELTETAGGARAMIGIGSRIDVGASVTAASGDYVATVNPTFPTFIESADREFSESSIVAGASLRPVPRLTLVGEFVINNSEIDDVFLDDLKTTKHETSGVRGGLEYYWRRAVTVRAGGQLLSETQDVTSPLEDTSVTFDRTRWTAGVGWGPRGGMFQLDTALAFTDSEASEPDALDDTSDGLSFIVSGRTLFR